MDLQRSKPAAQLYVVQVRLSSNFEIWPGSNWSFHNPHTCKRTFTIIFSNFLISDWNTVTSSAVCRWYFVQLCAICIVCMQWKSLSVIVLSFVIITVWYWKPIINVYMPYFPDFFYLEEQFTGGLSWNDAARQWKGVVLWKQGKGKTWTIQLQGGQ